MENGSVRGDRRQWLGSKALCVRCGRGREERRGEKEKKKRIEKERRKREEGGEEERRRGRGTRWLTGGRVGRRPGQVLSKVVSRGPK